MKRCILSLFAAICLLLITQNTFAQDTTKTDPSLSGQYQFMLSKSKTLYGAKLINPARLSGLWKNVKDTINTERKQLIASKAKINEQQKAITDLKAQIEGKESSLASSNAKQNEISFLGIPFTKSTYNTIVWTLIIVLALALAFVVIRSAKHIHEAKYRSTLYQEIADEYQAYKVKANDKEKKLARELQDERNKFEDYRSRER
jgi:septal ring factor EnvC (AmiA/AmiB activator)